MESWQRYEETSNLSRPEHPCRGGSDGGWLALILAYLYLWSGLAAEWLYRRGLWLRRWVNLWRCVAFLLLGSAAFGQGYWDESAFNEAWEHVYNPQRLQVNLRYTSATGVIVDATHGKRKQGCRSEADGDLHCWLHLDPGQEDFIDAENVKNQGGNLVFEPICQHKVTQADAKAACKNWTQNLSLPPVGTHVRIWGSAVTDLQHGHGEFHPVSKIEVLPAGALPKQ